MTLTPYPKYKDSNVEWLGDVPDHWEITRNKSYLKYRKDTVGDQSDEYTLLSLTLKGIIKRDMENPQGKFPAEFNTYKIVKPGDLVFCLFDIDETPRTVGLSKFNGMITGAYDILYSNNQTVIDYLYLYYLSIDNVKGLRPLYSGLRKVVPKDAFMSMKIALPPENEQRLIFRYINYINNKIQKYISAKRKLIKLLEEQKQAIIHQAVTGAIDVKTGKPFSNYVYTNNKWFEKIPNGWTLQKLKRLSTQIVDGTHFTPTYVDEGVPFLRVKDIHPGQIDKSSIKYISSEEYETLNKRCNPEKGDLLLSKNGTIGLTKVVDWDFKFSIFVSLCLIKLRKTVINPYYLSLLFEGSFFNDQIKDTSKTTSVTNLHLDKINSFITIVPPISEQQYLVNRLESINKAANDTIEKTKNELKLISEYRIRLISDVVTGKVDVRKVANTLPEELEVVDELDDSEVEVIEEAAEVDENESN